MHSPKFGKKLFSNRELGPGVLKINLHEDATVYIHSALDVPHNSEGDIKENVLYGSLKEIVISIMEMDNAPAAVDVPISVRSCRFYWELNILGDDALYDYYSYSTCTVECARLAQIKHCNCTHHLMPINKNGKYLKIIYFTELDFVL